LTLGGPRFCSIGSGFRAPSATRGILRPNKPKPSPMPCAKGAKAISPPRPNWLAELKTELKTEIAEAKTELLKWIIVVALGFQAVVILGALTSVIRIAAK
jgi:hypothetical protein